MRIIALLALPALLFTSGCAGLNNGLASLKERMERNRALIAERDGRVLEVPITIQALKVRMNLAPGKKETLKQGKVTMTLKPIVPVAERKVAVALSDTAGDCALGHGCYFYRQRIPYFAQGNQVMFSLSIENNLDQPLRLSNAIVALKIGNKDVPKESFKESYEELRGQVILPGSTYEGTFTGPQLASGLQASAITFALYDVVTELDAASNPTKRSAFVWQYQYSVEQEQQQEMIRYACMHISATQRCLDDRRGACPVDAERCAREGVNKAPLVHLLKR